MASVKVTKTNLIEVLRGEIAEKVVGGLRDRFEANIIASIPSNIKNDPPINVDVTYNLDKSSGSMKFDTKISSETVTGIKETQVSGSLSRSSHTRVLDGKRNFYIGGYDIPGGDAEAIRSAEGTFVTSNKVPDSILNDIVSHGVVATMNPSEHEGHSLDEHIRSGFE